MKYIKPLILLIAILFSSFLVTHCNTAEEALTPGKSLEAILAEIAALGEAEKKIISFDILFDKKTGLYDYTNVKIIEQSKNIVDFAIGADPGFKYVENSYEVECTDTEGNITTTHCSDYVCVGYAVAACVENGGCAKVCKAEAAYYPSEIT